MKTTNEENQVVIETEANPDLKKDIATVTYKIISAFIWIVIASNYIKMHM